MVDFILARIRAWSGFGGKKKVCIVALFWDGGSIAGCGGGRGCAVHLQSSPVIFAPALEMDQMVDQSQNLTQHVTKFLRVA
jgi:hypothetical protein